MTPSTQRAVRRWFAARGFVSLLDGTSLARRAAGQQLVIGLLVLLAVFVLGTWAAAGASAVPFVSLTLLFVVLVWVLSNLARRRRPLSLIMEVGWPERAGFVLAPTLAAFLAPATDPSDLLLMLGDLERRGLEALGWLLGQLLLLGVATLLVSSGLWSLGAWLRRQVITSFVAAGGALGRTLPLLLGVVGFFFFTTELWQTLGRLMGWGYVLALLLFVLLSWLFLSNRGHLDLHRLGSFDTTAEIGAELRDTPLAELDGVAAPACCPLTTEQENNLRLVATISRLTVASVIALAFFAFFLVFGVLVANAEVVASWIQARPQVVLAWETGNHAYALTQEHLRVAGFLGVFSGFYYAIVSVTDPALRAGLRDTAEDAIREACAARLVALHHFPQPERATG